MHKLHVDNRSYFCLRMGPLSTFRIAQVFDVTEFSAYGFDTGWKLYSNAPDGMMPWNNFKISIESDYLSQPINLYTHRLGDCESVVLNAETPIDRDYADLVFHNGSSFTIFIAICPTSTYKKLLINSCRGRGVELGPGINPHIINSNEVEVLYIEPKSSEQWVKTYNTDGKTVQTVMEQDRYIFGDARDIAELAGGGFDFIYSNHVIEHLLNPIFVISRCLSCLKPNGIFAGSVPSYANTFDLRQRPSTLDDLIDLEQKDFKQIPHYCYQRWVSYTEPRVTVESLIARSYSVHITFWTAELLADLFDLLAKRGLVSDCQIMYEPNSKDIQFVLSRGNIDNSM